MLAQVRYIEDRYHEVQLALRMRQFSFDSQRVLHPSVVIHSVSNVFSLGADTIQAQRQIKLRKLLPKLDRVPVHKAELAQIRNDLELDVLFAMGNQLFEQQIVALAKQRLTSGHVEFLETGQNIVIEFHPEGRRLIKTLVALQNLSF